ncbi:hypothetical protein P4U43_08125 [Arthrobacter sp. EH-1B-1]|uniref:Uncharacterized protein n=1 Tax=Arthrobacter vasquezii TaxID=2977629 RepID=A0ABT6CXH1_9MICC|nr:hypothetical protein [Arthrobacter vasquezii]
MTDLPYVRAALLTLRKRSSGHWCPEESVWAYQGRNTVIEDDFRDRQEVETSDSTIDLLSIYTEYGVP